MNSIRKESETDTRKKEIDKPEKLRRENKKPNFRKQKDLPQSMKKLSQTKSETDMLC